MLKSKYRKSIPARFFLYKNPPFKKKNIWFHSCSLGETKALKPLIEGFDAVNISVITATGYEEANKYKNSDVRFLPFEIFLPFWVCNCEKLVVMEAELWYMLFVTAKRKCKSTILINARISAKSYPKYLKFRWFYKKIFEKIDTVLAQSEEDKIRLQNLGAKNVKVTGNIKTYFKPSITTVYKKSKPLIVAASTHRGEEEMILKELPLEEYQVVVVPRHPERFDEVYDVMSKFKHVKRASEYEQQEGSVYLEDDFILMDKMGELVNLYAIADKVILGGSFVDKVGGHNPVEAAYFNKPIISGKYIFNQKSLYNDVENIICTDVSEIKEALQKAKPSYIKNRVSIDEILSILKL